VADPQILVVTSGTAPSAAVVPVLAAIEAAGMRVRAIDVGGDGADAGIRSFELHRASLRPSPRW